MAQPGISGSTALNQQNVAGSGDNLFEGNANLHNISQKAIGSVSQKNEYPMHTAEQFTKITLPPGSTKFTHNVMNRFQTVALNEGQQNTTFNQIGFTEYSATPRRFGATVKISLIAQYKSVLDLVTESVTALVKSVNIHENTMAIASYSGLTLFLGDENTVLSQDTASKYATICNLGYSNENQPFSAVGNTDVRLAINTNIWGSIAGSIGQSIVAPGTAATYPFGPGEYGLMQKMGVQGPGSAGSLFGVPVFIDNSLQPNDAGMVLGAMYNVKSMVNIMLPTANTFFTETYKGTETVQMTHQRWRDFACLNQELAVSLGMKG